MTTQLTAIEAAFDICSEGKSKSQKIDMILDYILDVERKKEKANFESLISFYDFELAAAKNKLKQISND